MKNQFTSPEVQKVLNAGREVFRSWVDAGFIVPSVQRSTQQGEQNLFDRIDVYGAGLFKHLTATLKMKRKEAGYHVAVWRDRVKSIPASPQAAASLYNFLVFMRSGEDIISCEHFSADRSSNYQAYSQIMGRVYAQVEGKQWDDILVVNMGNIVGQVEKEIAKLDE